MSLEECNPSVTISDKFINAMRSWDVNKAKAKCKYLG